MQQDGLEAALAAAQAQVETAARAAGVVARELKKARAGAVTGQVRELRKALDAAVTAGDELADAVRQAQSSYDFDETAHLSSGGYAKELLATAVEQGVAMFEEDDRLLCYPSLLRVLPGDAAVEVDRRRERRLRPSVVVAALAAAQARPPRFKAEPFLESLAAAYALLAEKEGKPDPVLRLDAVWGVLTLLPGAAREYSRPEFARDLYLLDQSGVTTTKAGRTLRWHASSGTRGAGVLTTVAKTGQQQRYWGVSFSGG
ncbi:MAG TPA: hypothetical protein VM433_01670 [Mycobacteriales bacterium]|nr:hypothetical protein [Mycobacteriales bacterium]